MPTLRSSDQVDLFYEEQGQGEALLFVHEFAGNYSSWAPQFAGLLARHDARGAAHTLRGVQAQRPSFEDVPALRELTVPMLIIAGDEDEHSLESSLYLKRQVASSGLLVLPKTGHTINLEEPERFNLAVSQFISSVQRNDWPLRDPRVTAEVMKL